MNNFKFSEELFIDNIELTKFQEFLDSEGFRKALKNQIANPGFVKNSYLDPNFENGGVFNSSTPHLTSTKIYLGIKDLNIIDKNGNFIKQSLTQRIPDIEIFVNASNIYWLKVSYQQSVKELGTVSIDEFGNLTGIGTEFTSLLRAQPNFPSKIKFVRIDALTSVPINTDEYEVVSVIDDTHAILSGVFSADSNIKYQIIGTFTDGYTVPSDDKYPFRYDSALFTVVDSDTAPSITEGEEFLLSKITVAYTSPGVYTLAFEDKRSEIFKLPTELDLESYLSNFITYSLLGIDSVKFSGENSLRETNNLFVSWGIQASTWSYSHASNSHQIVISEGKGGKLKSSSNFNLINSYSNVFANWILYSESGAKYNILSSSYNVGLNQITLILDYANSTDLSNLSQKLFFCPNVEEIEFQLINNSPSELDNEITPTHFNFKQSFPINDEVGKIDLLNNYIDQEYLIKYRYKVFKTYSPWTIIPNDTVLGYYNENQFLADGEPKVLQVRTTYTGGVITLIQDPLSYGTLNLKEKIGVRTIEINTSTFYDLPASSSYLLQLFNQVDKKYQVFNGGALSIAPSNLNFYINLEKPDGLKEGTSFLLHFKQEIIRENSTAGTVILCQDFVHDVIGPTTTFSALKTFNNNDFNFINNSEEGLFILATYDGTNWFLNSTNEIEPYSPWEVVEYDPLFLDSSSGSWTIPASPSTNFKVTYKKVGKTVTLNFRIVNSSLSSTPASARLKLPASMVIKTAETQQWNNLGFYGNTNDTPTFGPIRIEANAGADELYLSKLSGSHAAITGGFDIFGQITFEID